MKEGFFKRLIGLIKYLSTLYEIDLTGKKKFDSNEFLDVFKKFVQTDESTKEMYESLKKEMGHDFDYIFKKYQKIAVLMNSGDKFLKEMTREEMDTYEDSMRMDEGKRFGKVEHIWKEFKSGNVGFSELVNEGFEILEEEFLPFVVPLIDKEEFIV